MVELVIGLLVVGVLVIGVSVINVGFRGFTLRLKNWNRYRYWKSRRKGKKYSDLLRGPGYYIVSGLGINPLGQLYHTKMMSGKIGVYELIDLDFFSDPWDMVKESRWCFLGYQNEKAVASCSFEEYLFIYVKKGAS